MLSVKAVTPLWAFWASGVWKGSSGRVVFVPEGRGVTESFYTCTPVLFRFPRPGSLYRPDPELLFEQATAFCSQHTVSHSLGQGVGEGHLHINSLVYHCWAQDLQREESCSVTALSSLLA